MFHVVYCNVRTINALCSVRRLLLLILFTYSCVQDNFRVRWWCAFLIVPSVFSKVISYRLTVTLNVSLVEKELLSIPISGWVRVAKSLVVCVLLCVLFVAFSYFFIWSLNCLSFFDLQLYITLFISSNVHAAAPDQHQFVVISRWRSTATWEQSRNIITD